MTDLKQAKAIVWLAQNKDIAKKFAFHFQSQAKPNTEKLSKTSAKLYAKEAWELFEALETIIK